MLLKNNLGRLSTVDNFSDTDRCDNRLRLRNINLSFNLMHNIVIGFRVGSIEVDSFLLHILRYLSSSHLNNRCIFDDRILSSNSLNNLAINRSRVTQVNLNWLTHFLYNCGCDGSRLLSSSSSSGGGGSWLGNLVNNLSSFNHIDTVSIYRNIASFVNCLELFNNCANCL